MIDTVLSTLRAKFGNLDSSEFRGQTRVVIPAEKLQAAMELLKNELKFDLLIDVTCVDYLNKRDATDRFGLVYCLARTSDNLRLIVRCSSTIPIQQCPAWCRCGRCKLVGARMLRHVWDHLYWSP